tara:strand:+ start:2100 stop:4268 length:2169 start_codon:yes stop_codon:yes gene_type:complete
MAEEILIRINLQSGEAKSKIREIKQATDNYAVSIDNLSKGQLRSLVAEQKLNLQRQITKKQVQELALAEINAAAASKNNRAQSGLSNAILLETGRLASDASFGFTAIANNLSQLISLFQSFARTNGGVISSFKTLGRSLLGSGGVIIAIQFLISFGDDIYNFFFQAEKAAKEFDEKLKDLTKTLDEQIDSLDNLAGTYLRYNQTGNATADISKILSFEFRKFKVGLQNLKDKGLDKVDASVNSLIKSYMRLLKRQKDLIVTEEKLKEAVKDQTDDGQKRYIRLTGERKEIIRELIELEKLFTRESGKETKARVRLFKEGILQLKKLEEQYRQESIDNDLKTKEELIKQEEEFRISELRIQLETFKAKEELRKRDFISQTKARKLSKQKEQQVIDDANRKFDDSITKAENSVSDVIVQIKAVTNTKLTQLNRERIMDAADTLTKIRLLEVGLGFTLDALSIKQKGLTASRREGLNLSREIFDQELKAATSEVGRLEGKKSDLEVATARLEEKLNDPDSGLSESEKATGFATLMDMNLELVNTELELTKAVGKETDLRTKLYNIEADAKVESLKLVGGALTAFSKLAGEDTKLGKALAISATLISTYLSAQKAFESQFKPMAIVDSPVRGAIAAAAAIASGLANVKAIASVNPKGSGSGSAGAAQKPTIKATAPDFNVVGASQVSQLAQSVSGQVTKPVKAFVVGKEITSQQELDRNINNTAGI